MKAQILNHLENIQDIMDSSIYPIKEEVDRFDSNKFYWYYNVLDFILEVKKDHPNLYEGYSLEYAFEDLKEFGLVYDKIIFTGTTYDLDEYGVLGITVPIEKMIRDLYDYVINLEEPIVTPAHVEPINSHATLMELMQKMIAGQSEIKTSVEKVEEGQKAVVNKIDLHGAGLSDITSLVTEVNAVKTGKLYQPKTKVKKKTKKQIEEEEDLLARQFAHQHALNRLD